MSNEQVLVKGKNGEDRLIPFQTQTKRLLNRYIKARGNSPVDWLFITHDDEKMNRDSVRGRTAKKGPWGKIRTVGGSRIIFGNPSAKRSVKKAANTLTHRRNLEIKRPIM